MADLESSEHDAPTTEVRDEDESAVIRLAGDLDMASVNQARAAIGAALAGQRNTGRH